MGVELALLYARTRLGILGANTSHEDPGPWVHTLEPSRRLVARGGTLCDIRWRAVPLLQAVSDQPMQAAESAGLQKG